MGSARAAGAWIGYHARVSPDRTALHDLASGRRFTYRELDGRAARLAGALAGSFGVRAGDRVAMLSRNCAQAFETMYACARLGAIFVPLNVRLSDPELEALASDAGPALLLGEQELLARDVAAGLPQLSWEQDYEPAIAAGPAQGRPALVSPDHPWVIIYTSGTTGRPKGVLVTHAGSDATMLAALMSSGVTRDSVCLTALPVWHVAGLNLYANPVLFAGGTVLIMQAFDPGAALELLTSPGTADAAHGPVTHFTGVPAHYQFMQATPGWADADFPPFVAGVGGSPVPAALVEDWRRRGVTLRCIYGISEAGALVTITPPGESAAGPGDAGLPVWHLECRITGPGGQPWAPGEPGELQIAGVSVTPGYWGRPEETAQAVSADGWLSTGDVATMTAAGRVAIIDRIKDMYISGGENVYPTEVEEVLYQHPAVAEAAVIGVPDERWMETGAAWLVLAEGATATADDLRAWVRARLAAFKVPRDIHFADALPRNATGKVLKAQLRRPEAPGTD
jgi:fatty-acyl-CoA synthase